MVFSFLVDTNCEDVVAVAVRVHVVLESVRVFEGRCGGGCGVGIVPKDMRRGIVIASVAGVGFKWRGFEVFGDDSVV
jgi:hypothetical protein